MKAPSGPKLGSSAELYPDAADSRFEHRPERNRAAAR
jgi:hypothetical protein